MLVRLTGMAWNAAWEISTSPRAIAARVPGPVERSSQYKVVWGRGPQINTSKIGCRPGWIPAPGRDSSAVSRSVRTQGAHRRPQWLSSRPH